MLATADCCKRTGSYYMLGKAFVALAAHCTRPPGAVTVLVGTCVI